MRSDRPSRFVRTRGRSSKVIVSGAIAASLVLTGCSSASSTASPATSPASAAPAAAPSVAAPAASGGPVSSGTTKALRLAYLPFSIANSYEAPMQAAAEAAAKAGNATLTVLSADNDPQKQYAQLQTVLSSGQYDGIVVQPILSTGLTPLVTQAVAKGLKVVTVDQILGPDLTTTSIQVPGLSGSVVFNPTTLGTKFGTLVAQACTDKKLNPCNVGYLYDLKASSLDVAIHGAFVKAVAGTPAIKIVGEGEDFYTPSKGLSATQNLLQAHPEINLIAASDQGIEGAVQAVSSAGVTGKVTLVGYGGSVAGIQGVSSGQWYGTIAQLPATEGTDAVNALIKALRSGTPGVGTDPSAAAPNGGVITKATAPQFTGQWPG